MRPFARGREVVPGTTVIGHLHRSKGYDVYDAWNEPRACRVVVKTLRPDRVTHPGAAGRLLREGRTLAQLTHPHIVRAYEVHDGSRPVVLLETLGGQTLAHLIEHARRPLGTAELANLGTHLASALVHLHSRGLLHLDLKPANVVAEAGRAKVIDLSHARPPGRHRPGNGTWCHMAPEQARGGGVGTAADVWGLGIVLHAAASSRTAIADLADEHDCDLPQLEHRIPSLARDRPRLPQALTALVDACLEPDPARRPSLGRALRTLDGMTG